MTEIRTEKNREVVGEIYNDSWGRKSRVFLYEWDSEKHLNEGSIARILSDRGYETEEFGNSGECDRIIYKYEENICADCGQKCFYDEKLNEFYCSVCE